LRNVGESSVAVIVVQNCAPVSRDIEIGVAVIIVVAHCHTLAIVSLSANSGLLGDVGKRPVTIVVVEGAAQWMGWLVKVGCGGLDEIKVHQSILIVVKPGNSGPHSFEVVLLVRRSGVLLEGEPSGFGNIRKSNRLARAGCRRNRWGRRW